LRTLLTRVLIASFVLVMFLPFSEVFAASYRAFTYIYVKDDSQRRHWADIRIEYTFPDTVKASEEFDVQVSLTYLKNENANLPWIEFFFVGVHTRKLPTGPDLTSSKVDPSRRRLTAGEQYSNVFSLKAPSEPLECLVALTWKTFTPEARAYGMVRPIAEIQWDTGTLPRIQDARLVVSQSSSFTLFGLDRTQLLQVAGGGVAAVAVPALGLLFKTRKRRFVSSYLTRVDSVYNEYFMNREECRKRLVQMKDEIVQLLKKGKIDEPHFTIIDAKLERYMKDLA